jgi:predicted HicB family RNase H-like nuclease
MFVGMKGVSLMSNERKQVTVKFEPDLHQRLQEAAAREQRSLANFIRKTCAEATARQDVNHAA